MSNVSDINVSDIVEYLVPFVVAAGSYSVGVQSRIDVHKAKGGPTAFHHALSDADLSIQGYLEVALLARYPDVSFFSEEQSQSLNVKYFPVGAELEVLLDPVDGTRAYIAGRKQYQIIVTLHDHDRIVGVLCYMPRFNRCYVATRGAGAFVRTHEECRRGAQGVRLDVTQSTGPVLVFNRPDILECLQGTLDVRDLAQEYDRKDEEQAYYSTDLLAGRASSVVCAPVQAIDGGALAFIAEEAGAIVTDVHGAELASFRSSAERVLPVLIASARPAVHERVLRLLQASRLFQHSS
jgi:myo-inositol-1(or 4)-monophosphatase